MPRGFESLSWPPIASLDELVRTLSHSALPSSVHRPMDAWQHSDLHHRS